MNVDNEVTRDLTFEVLHVRAEYVLQRALEYVTLDIIDVDRLYDSLDGVRAAKTKRELLLALDVALLGYIPGGIHTAIQGIYHTLQESL